MTQLLNTVAKTIADLWQWSLANPDIAIWIAGAILGCLGWLFSRLWKQIQRLRRFLGRSHPSAITDSFSFEVIPPENQKILPVLLGSNQAESDPLADFNIPYQSERKGIPNTQAYLEQRLEQNRWLLLLAPSGVGKTREAAELAARLNRERWTVLKLKNHEWLEVPTTFPADRIGGVQPKLLFFLDNLNQAMVLGKRAISSNEDGTASPFKLSLQERLLRTLEFYERVCGPDRVRVIATARSEPEEREKLGLDEYRSFWQRFEQFPLPESEPQAFNTVLQSCTTAAGISGKADEFEQIARSNDGTFRNIVENLLRVRNRNLPLSLQTFRDTLEGTWEDRYRAVVKKYPLAVHIYDAIDLLRQLDVALQNITVTETAQLLANGKGWQKLQNRWQIHRTLKTLISDERILQPRDGQIEAKGHFVAAKDYVPTLPPLLLKLADRFKAIRTSLIPLAQSTYNLDCKREALIVVNKLLTFEHEPQFLQLLYAFKGSILSDLENHQEAIASYDKAVEIKQDNYAAWNNRSLSLHNLGRYEEAVASCDKAVEVKPDKHEAWYNRGISLDDLGRYEEAIANFDKAVVIKPDDHKAWNNRGTSLHNLGRYEEAITSYDKAVEVKPDKHEAWYNRGISLDDLGRYEEAIASYDKALEIKPDKHEVWNNRGTSLANLGRYEEAIASYDKALEIKPDDHKAWNNCGCALVKWGQYETAINSFDRASDLQPNFANAYYNKACCFALQKQVSPAVEQLRRAIELDLKYREEAKTDADFDRIREAEEFQALIFGSE